MAKRLIEKVLKQLMSVSGAILIYGAKDIGKTYIGLENSKTVYRLDDIESNTLEKINKNISIIAIGKKPILIDEWQLMPKIWNYIRNIIDKYNEKGMYILTGSSSPYNKKLLTQLHSGAGRFSRIKIYPLSCTELNKTNKKINFIELFEKINIKDNDISIKQENIYELIAIGGRPRLLEYSLQESELSNKQYIDNIIDYSEKQQFISKKVLTNYLLTLSRNIGCFYKTTHVASEINITRQSLYRYEYFLSNSGIIEFLDCWNSHIRSSAKITKAKKIYFNDPSIPYAVLNLSIDKLKNDTNAFGLYFESLVIRDLRTYATIINASISYYHDSSGLEIDCIIEKKDGTWIAIEIKKGSKEGIENGKKNLNKLRSEMSIEKRYLCKGLYIITSDSETNLNNDDIKIINFLDLYFEER